MTGVFFVGKWAKFESRDEWLGIRDWGLGVTSDWNASRGYLHYLYSAALLYFYAPHHHFEFLISNFSFKRSFQTESKGSTPLG